MRDLLDKNLIKKLINDNIIIGVDNLYSSSLKSIESYKDHKTLVLLTCINNSVTIN